MCLIYCCWVTLTLTLFKSLYCFDCGNRITSWVQNGQFSEEEGFILYVILKRKYRDSNPIHGLRGETNSHFTAELSDLLMNGHKSSVYQVQNTLFTNQSGIRNCHKMTNCEQFRTKCCVKIVATLTLATTDVFLIKM